MKKTLWEELRGVEFIDENDHELVDWLAELGIHIDYDNRMNDLFFVRLYNACENGFEGLIEPITLKGACTILRDLLLADGQVYDIVLRFTNGFDLAYTFDGGCVDMEEIFVTNGKCVSDSPVMQFVLSEEEMSVIDALESLPRDAHLLTTCEIYMSTEKWAEELRGSEAAPEVWKDECDTDDWNVAKEKIEKERKTLHQKYS